MIKFLFMILQFSWSQGTVVIEPYYDELEGPALIEALIQNKNVGAAEDQIHQLPPAHPKKLLFQVQVLGLQKKPQAVLEALRNQTALSLDLKIELAKAYHQLQKFTECSEVFQQGLENAPIFQQGLENLGVFYECHFKSKKYDQAFAIASSSDQPEFLQLQWSWMTFFKLNSLAKEKLADWAQKKPLADEWLLRLLEDLPAFEQVHSLEILKLIRPQSSMILARWAENQYKSGHTQNASIGFQAVSALNSDFLFVASELLRSQKDYQQARYLSQGDSRIETQLKSKIQIAVDQKAYSQIFGLLGPFERSQLLNDQDIVYSFVYSLRETQPEKARRLSHHLHRADLKIKVQQLMNSL